MKKNKKLLDIIGASCGMFLVAALIISLISSAVASAPPKGAVTLTGTAPGRNADVAVEVVTDGSTIAGVAVTAHEETEGIGTMAVDELPGKIVEANSLAVDNVSGASITSEAIKAAVANALTQGGFDASAFGFVAAAPAEEPAPAEAPAAPAAPAEPVEIPDDAITETGSYNGIDGPVVTQVTADAERIYDVQVLEQNETVGIGSVAVEKLPGAIVAANSLLVDDISGATVTSTAIKNGIREALTKAGLDPAVFEVEPENAGAPAEKTEETLDCDVVVVGAGGAGLTAAVRATQQGAKVLVVEKMPIIGGNSLRAEGGMNAADTKVQAELGITDSTVENFVADTLRLGHDLANPDLVQTLAENSAEAVDWLDSIGAPLTKVAATGGTEHKYLHKPEDGRPVGSYLVEKLSAYAEQLGIEIRINTKATEILMSGSRACGIKAEDDEHVYTINAKAVVLATGGFGSNFELMASYDPSLADAVTTNHSGAQGDGIMMAQAVGADTVDMEQIQLHPTVIQQNGLLVSESVRSHGAILVNAEGKRFVNDMAGRDVVSQAELKQPGAYAFIVFDQGLVDEVALTHKFIDGGYAISGESYEELAKNLGLEGDAIGNFVETMENWNAAVAAGEDKDFGRSAVSMIDISTAPYYAIKIAPGIHHTMGGIKIDTQAQVIDTEGDVIAGLFACGETTGGIHGGNRVGGNAVCDFIVFGRIAGTSAAEYAAAIAPAEYSSQAFTETGSYNGIDGPVVTQVTADAERIYAVEVIEQNETQGIGSVAVEKLPGAIVAANSLLVDDISGATVTSTAIKNGIREALQKAGLDPAVFEVEPSAAAAGSAEIPENVTLEYDVVVVGAGGAGLTAAVRATQEGAKVLVVEKMPIIGGNSLRAEGGMNAADTKVQAELGLTDSTVENFVADTLRLGHDLANPDLVQTLAENSAEAVDWLDSIGAPLTKVAATGGTEHKYLHKPEDGRPVGSYLVEKLSAYADQLGIQIMINTEATEIVRDSLGIVRGVVCKGEAGNTINVNARSVVLATGGFGSNFELMASFDPSLADAVTTNHSGAQGDGILMAQAIGADTVDMEQIQLHPTVIQQNGLLVSESVRSHGAILVNAEGKRFVNDMAGRDVVSQAELKQPGAYAFIVFDQGLVDEVALTHKFIDGGYAVSGETYEELAQAMGLEGDAIANFAETMENWNAFVEAGEDKDFGRSAVSMIDISTAPYYAIKIAPGIHHTMGGIKIDTQAQVIDTEGNVIPGLFAAGETTGGIHGGNRVGGNAVCDFIVFGRIAGASAAAYADR